MEGRHRGTSCQGHQAEETDEVQVDLGDQLAVANEHCHGSADQESVGSRWKFTVEDKKIEMWNTGYERKPQ
jgi:hypothetical protein